MTLLVERMERDRTEARKESNTALSSFLGYLISEARKPGKDAKPPRESTEDEVVAIIRKNISHNDENLRLTNGADKNAEWQNKILNDYLPTQLSDEDVERLVREFVNGQNWTDEQKSPRMLGAVMSMLKECYSGQYNPKRASEIARNILSE